MDLVGSEHVSEICDTFCTQDLNPPNVPSFFIGYEGFIDGLSWLFLMSCGIEMGGGSTHAFVVFVDQKRPQVTCLMEGRATIVLRVAEYFRQTFLNFFCSKRKMSYNRKRFCQNLQHYNLLHIK